MYISTYQTKLTNICTNFMESLKAKDAELAGQIAVVDVKLANLTKNFEDSIKLLNLKLDQLISNETHFVGLEQFEKFQERVMPVVKWVEDRRAVEKFVYGVIGFLGLSNLILIVKIVFGL